MLLKSAFFLLVQCMECYGTISYALQILLKLIVEFVAVIPALDETAQKQLEKKMPIILHDDVTAAIQTESKPSATRSLYLNIMIMPD